MLPLVVGPVWCLAWHGQIGWLGTLSGFVLLAVLVTSAITDFQRHKFTTGRRIPRSCGRSRSTSWRRSCRRAKTCLTRRISRSDRSARSCWAASASASAWPVRLCASSITLVGYHLSGGGAGDVKLAAAIGALLGVHDGVFAVAYSYMVAAIAIIAWSICHNGPLALVKAAVKSSAAMLGPLWPFPPSDSDAKLLDEADSAGPVLCHRHVTRSLGARAVMKRCRANPTRIHAARRGMMSLEVVMTIAVMLPIAGALLFLGIKMCATLYQAIGALVSWPFL